MPQKLQHLRHSGLDTGKPILLAQGEKEGVTGVAGVGESGAEHTTGHAVNHEAEPGEVPAAPLLFWNSVLIAICMVAFALLSRRNLAKVPRGIQNIAEYLVESLNNFTISIIGHGGEKYTPLVGTLFIYIVLMNLIGQIPTLHSPTANVSITLALGMVVFFYVQYEGIRTQGPIGYVKHFMGPMPALAPLMIPVELISELVKPFTLAIRLFGNIFGEDVILVVLAGLGGLFGASFLPFHFPIILLALLTAFVQALVFSMLTCIYISLVTHHDTEPGEHEAVHATAPGH